MFRPMLRRTLQGLFVLCLAILLAGCSLGTLAYNRLPTWVYWRLDGLLDLSDTQAALVRPALREWHDWHRREHLPRYAEALRQWQQLALDDLSAEQTCRTFEQVRGWAHEAADRFLPAMAALAPTLSDAQLDHWGRQQRRQDAEFAEAFGDAPGAVSPRRLQRAIDRAEMFYGRLDDAQRAWLRERLARSAFDPQRALEERQRRHAEAREAVQRIRAGQDPLRQVRAVWANTLQSPRESYRLYSERLVRDGCAQFAELHNRTTPEQRQRAVQRLQAFERDVLLLIQGR